MVRNLGKKVVIWSLVLIFTFITTGTASALSSERLGRFSNYRIYFYDPDANNCIPGSNPAAPGIPSGPITLTGSSRAEKIWNYIVDLGISGLSDRPEAIAGVLGNMATETGNTFNPFIQNSGGCTGIIQWCKGSWNDGFFSYMTNRGFDKYYYKGSQPNIDESIISEGIVAELDFLFKGGSGGVTASKYIANLNVPSSKSGTQGARAYSDLFLVTVENAFGGSDSLEDPGVKSIAGYSTYQAASSRRTHAAEMFAKYGGSSGGTGSNETEEVSGGGSAKFCDEEDDEEEDEEELGSLAELVKKWAWPEYHAAPYITRMPAYAEYMDTKATYRGDCAGADCGAFVANIIKASGWDPNYPQCGTGCQSSWLSKNWDTVSVGSLKLGDVGIKSGHVILYVGSLPGFGSNTASASQCDRAPMAGADKNLNIYTWYRRR